VAEHDPEKTVADLREHLTRHDKRIAFLCGAGTSCAAGSRNGEGEWLPLIPAVPGLTTKCKEKAAAANTKFAGAWEHLETHCRDDGQDHFVESILSRLRMMKRAMGRDDQLVGLSREEVGDLEECIRRSIVETVNPDLETEPEVFPHRAFARWVSKATRKFPVEVFTLNYDLLFEHALEQERVAVFDGFVGSSRPYFHAETLTQPGFMPGMMWTRLWKMHGSVNWSRATIRGSQRVVRGPVSEKGELIFPSFEKYDESRQQPYSAFTSRLRTFLEEDDSLLVVLGYSFSDEHVNEVIYGALEASARTHVYALQFDMLDDACALLKRARQCRNLVVVSPSCGAGGGVVGSWSKDAELLAAQSVMDVGEDGGRAMRLGDFARFSTFLESMSER
jgi:hypothetical protein